MTEITSVEELEAMGFTVEEPNLSAVKGSLGNGLGVFVDAETGIIEVAYPNGDVFYLGNL